MGFVLLAALLVTSLVACNEKVIIDPEGSTADSGVADMGADEGPPPEDTGPQDVAEDPDPIEDVDLDGAMVLCEPTLEGYQEIYSTVLTSCGGPGCHGGQGRFYLVPGMDSPENVSASFNSALDFVGDGSCEDPASSQLLMIARNEGGAHGGINVQGEPGYGALQAWLSSGLTVVRPDVGMPDGGMEDVAPDGPEAEPFPCDGLPSIDGLPYAYPYDTCPEDAELPCATFVEHVNPLLMTQCGRGDCHGGRGNGMYLLTGDDECVPRWNYFSTYWYVDHAETRTSPLLTRPLVDDPQDAHTGLGSLGVSTSCEHLTILKWLAPSSYENWAPCE